MLQFVFWPLGVMKLEKEFEHFLLVMSNVWLLIKRLSHSSIVAAEHKLCDVDYENVHH